MAVLPINAGKPPWTDEQIKELTNTTYHVTDTSTSTSGHTVTISTGNPFSTNSAPIFPTSPWSQPVVYPDPTPKSQPGWVCPVCHGGVAPWRERCPCKPMEVADAEKEY